MKFVKSLLCAVALGAAAHVGTFLAEKGIHAAEDPVKRATCKRKLNEIKNVIFKKEEES